MMHGESPGVARALLVLLFPSLLASTACVESQLDNAFDPQYPFGLLLELSSTTIGGSNSTATDTAFAVCQSSDVTIGTAALTGAAWTQFGGNLDNLGAMVANHAATGFDTSGNPWVVFREETSLNVGRVYLKYWNGATWIQPGSQPINPADMDQTVTIAMIGDTPYIAYVESVGNNNLYIHTYDGANWSLLGGAVADLDSTKAVGAHPSLALNDSRLYVAWSEDDGTGAGQLRVKYWNGGAWVQVGGALNVDTAYSASWPSLKFYNDVPYVSFIQSGATTANFYVKGYNPTTAAWELLGNGGILASGTTNVVSFNTLDFNNDGVPFVAYQINDTNASPYVSYLQDCTNWNQLGGEVSITPATVNEMASLAMNGDTPYVAYHDFGAGNTKVRYWNGSAWTTIGAGFQYAYPRMIFDGTSMWVALDGASNASLHLYRYQ